MLKFFLNGNSAFQTKSVHKHFWSTGRTFPKLGWSCTHPKASICLDKVFFSRLVPNLDKYTIFQQFHHGRIPVDEFLYEDAGKVWPHNFFQPFRWFWYWCCWSQWRFILCSDLQLELIIIDYTSILCCDMISLRSRVHIDRVIALGPSHLLRPCSPLMLDSLSLHCKSSFLSQPRRSSSTFAHRHT